MPSLADALRDARRQAGVSGVELARRVGRSQSWVSRVEHGRATPDATDVERLAKALDLSSEQTAELVALAAEPRPVLPARERAARIRRIETLLAVVAEEVRQLR